MAAAAPTAFPGSDTRNTPARRWVTPGRVLFVLVTALIYLGWKVVPTELYITPRTGLGYALGICGGSMMVFLLLYSARKRVSWLRFLGSVTRWFEVHMVLGVLGPLCILYHSNFSLGATNSNVAFWSMLTVAGSGLVGRYLYAHVHYGLYGRQKALTDLKNSASRLNSLGQRIPLLPELFTKLEGAEQRVLDAGPRLPLLEAARPLVICARTLAARWQLRGYIRRTLRGAVRNKQLAARDRGRVKQAAFRMVDTRLRATRSVAEFEVYQRLFGLWHVLHLPLIFMMFIAGTVHVIAVHTY